MENGLFKDGELDDLFAELQAEQTGEKEPEDKELDASQKRYMEIIQKHKNND